MVGYLKRLMEVYDLQGGTYIEPYAGGASVALSLLYEGYARHIKINDKDRSIFAFWHAVLNDTEELCRRIQDTPVTMETWQAQREVQRQKETADLLILGFSTFFLNRTNRSGILSGGVIGGKEQTGNYLMDARYNNHDLIVSEVSTLLEDAAYEKMSKAVNPYGDGLACGRIVDALR